MLAVFGVKLDSFLRRAALRQAEEDIKGLVDAIMQFAWDPESVMAPGDLRRRVADQVLNRRAHVNDAAVRIEFA